MTTKLQAINTMLSCIGSAPLNTLEGTKSYFTISAENILEAETKNVQLKGWQFNSEAHYQLTPDEDNIIKITDDMLMVDLPVYYKNRYVVREGKLYDKFEHTYEIEHPVWADIVWLFDFDDLPEVVKTYCMMSAAYKFVKRELGSTAACQYTQEDLLEAYVAMNQHELETGDYTMIPEYVDGRIKGGI